MPAELDRWLDDRLAGRGGGLPVLVVVAHPDDEVLGCGALLARLAEVRVIHVTDGAPRNGEDARRHGFATPGAYAAARRAEALAALALAGIAPDRLSGLAVPDQAAVAHLAFLARRIGPLLTGCDLVLTHAFEGGHPDHDAVAFAVHAAARRISEAARPVIAEMPFYHAAPEGWRRQVFLPHPGAGAAHEITFDAAARALKGRMIDAHASQADTLRAFDVTTERFRIAPPYDFTVRPHGGDLLYERHGWNLDWPTWVARVRDAEATLARDSAA